MHQSFPQILPPGSDLATLLSQDFDSAAPPYPGHSNDLLATVTNSLFSHECAILPDVDDGLSVKVEHISPHHQISAFEASDLASHQRDLSIDPEYIFFGKSSNAVLTRDAFEAKYARDGRIPPPKYVVSRLAVRVQNSRLNSPFLRPQFWQGSSVCGKLFTSLFDDVSSGKYSTTVEKMCRLTFSQKET
jgi:hypothetical protein